MKLNDLCDFCIPSSYNPKKYDEYGDLIKPILCDDVPIVESIINEVLAHQVIQTDTMMETNNSVFTTKNKLYCEE